MTARTPTLPTAEQRSAVDQLMADYARFADRHDGPAWSALFAEDGVVVFGELHVRGRAELAEFIQGGPRGTHLQGPISLQEKPDGSLEAYSSFAFVRADGVVIAGSYIDELVKAAHSGYLFARRTMEVRTDG